MLGASWAPALQERPQRTAGVTTSRKAGGVKPACGRQAALTEAMSGDSEKGAPEEFKSVPVPSYVRASPFAMLRASLRDSGQAEDRLLHRR